jgi:hypothetical protein
MTNSFEYKWAVIRGHCNLGNGSASLQCPQRLGCPDASSLELL